MKMNQNDSLRFSIILTLLLSVSFVLHGFIQHKLEIGFFEKLLPLTYLFNLLITISFFSVMVKFNRGRQSQLGMVFLYSSLIKFLLFFIFIYPRFNSFSGVRSAEFASFFIPYSLSISAEIIYLVKLLNKNDQ